MPRISIDNYDTVATWNGDSDLFIVEQPDGTKVATPNMVRQFMESFYDDVPIEGSERAVKSGGIFSTMAVPKYDSANRREYYEGGAAFDGNIDSTPTAGSNNAVASGGTKTYVDNVITTAMDNCKMAVFIKTFSSLDVATAWGSMYESPTQSVDISSLGLSSAPKAVLIGGLAMGATMIPKLSTASSTQVNISFVRPTAVTGVSVTISILVLY